MSLADSISIRPIRRGDEEFLREMLYYALYVPPGSEPLPRSIIDQPEISRYVQSWGRPGDEGVIAVYDPERLPVGAAPVGAAPVGAAPVGAAWIRLLTGVNRGYGYLDDETPELSMAVLPHHRGKGIGTLMLKNLFREIAGRYPAISLSVSKSNPAVNLYRRLGFEARSSDLDSLTMVKSVEALNHP
jgi:ribosomal protein S18 acetylase RimI-like enzyme